MSRHGAWKRAGLHGVLTGLDLVGALASLPAHCDRERARRFILIGEPRYLEAALARKTDGGGDGE